ncbi:hypothetical protein GCM10028805_54300 [Spirosoma harenae]
MTTLITNSPIVPLTRDFKVRLLKAIQTGELDIRQFPELVQAGRTAIESDLEGLSQAELATVTEAIRILDRIQS